MSEAIRQTVLFDAEPERVFEALMDSKLHATFTGAPARISRKPGGAVSAYGSFVTGYNLHIVQNRAIMQAWRASDWPSSAWSVASFLLELAARGRTRLTFAQYGVPEAAAKGIRLGWKSAYWVPLRKMLKAIAEGPKALPAKRMRVAPAGAKPRRTGRA